MDNTFQTLLDQVDSANIEAQNRQAKDAEDQKHQQELAALQDSIQAVSDAVTSAIAKKSNVVKVDNFPKAFATPDVQAVVAEIQALRQQLDADSKSGDASDAKEQATLETQVALLANLEKAVNAIPSKIVIPEAATEVTVTTNQLYVDKIQAVVDAVKAIKMDFKPTISVKPTDVTVNTDLSLLENKLDVLTTAVKAISVVIPEPDDSKMLEAIQQVSKTINNLSFPVPNYVLPFKNASGAATQAPLDANGILQVASPVLTERYDYSDNQDIFVGEAPKGTADNALGWTIYRYDLASSSAASGKVATDVSWDNRMSGVYQ